MKASDRHFKFKTTQTAVLLAVLSVLVAPKVSFAQCEMPGQPAIAGTAAVAADGAAVTAATTAITLNVEAATTAGRMAILEMMEVGWELIQGELNTFWDDWHEALQGQTAQLHGGQVDQTRQMSSNYDTSNMGESQRLHQEKEYEAKKEYIPTDEGCRFDTTAHYMNTAGAVKKAVSTGYSADFSKTVSNKAGTPAANGKASDAKVRWDNYVAKFCDRSANDGGAGCTANGTQPNAHILPSRTLFAKPTIDMTNADTRDAVNQLIFNVSGYKVPDPMPPAILESAAGKERRLHSRENLTQMDAVGALVWDVVAERSQGKAAPEVQAMRQRMGASDASPNPSEREIRQSVVEQLWDPAYYVHLIDGSATTAQKDLYLRAYNLYMLYRLIEKTEKIATVQAVQTANMLEATAEGRGSAYQQGSNR